MKSKYHTQWAAQFYVAAELTRRGYLVSLTLGNAPRTDLIVTSPNGKNFRVECKGMLSKTSWLFKSEGQPDLFYFFVFIPHLDAPRYFMLNAKEAHRILSEYSSNHPNQNKAWSGCNWRDIANQEFEDNWDVLPK